MKRLDTALFEKSMALETLFAIDEMLESVPTGFFVAMFATSPTACPTAFTCIAFLLALFGWGDYYIQKRI